MRSVRCSACGQRLTCGSYAAGRSSKYQDLEGAFGRRALIERAEGILMERHSVDEDAAFEMLRERSRIANRKLIDLAAAVVDGHRLLPKHPTTSHGP